jgi:hypothetical protein
LQLVGIEITYEGKEHNLGVKNRSNYATIVVVNKSVDGKEMGEGYNSAKK